MYSSLLFAVVAVMAPAPAAAPDQFDYYINPVLTKAIEKEHAKEFARVGEKELSDHDRVIPGAGSTCLLVKTNDGRNAKLLCQIARQKIGGDQFVWMLLIERYVTYREGEERTILASGKNLSLFAGFRLSLDLGQIVPAELGGDLRFVVDGANLYVEPLAKAKLYVLVKPMPDLAPKKMDKLVIGETFETRYFNGTYKLYEDGRRSGTLKLQVDDDGKVTGSYYSDKDGQKYAVAGVVGTPKHALEFSIKFPRSESLFSGLLFTGDGKALTGTCQSAAGKTGFYALRIEE
jgi:hypothetical protein